MIEAIALAFALAMDATAVSATRGMSPGLARDAVILPLLFGAAQAAMTALGWLTGDWGGEYFEQWDHWIAFALLVGMGVKMILDSRLGKPPPSKTGVMLYLALALATSIDAMAAGIAVPLLPVNPWMVIAIVGGVTAVCCLAGFLVGRAIGDRFGRRLNAVAGLILIAIGIRVLVEHLR
jgi:putative Mn2+ efflux pump MntP